MEFKRFFSLSNYKLIYIFILINLIQNTFQYADETLSEKILNYKKKALEKLEKYKSAFKNQTENMTKNEIERAIFFNETGISNLEQITVNQKTEGVKYNFVPKYFKLITKRLKLSDDVLKFFEPIFFKATEQTDEWKSYQLMYSAIESENIYFVNFLVKNRFEAKKIDIITNQVSMKFKISNFILIQESTTDENGEETKSVEYITKEIHKKDVDNNVQVIQDVITYTAYNSLIEFLGIEENKKTFTFLG